MEMFSRDWSDDPVRAKKALIEDFEARARLGSLGSLESLAGQYALYCPDAAYGSYLLMSLLLRLPPAKRIQAHNWAVAGDMPRGTREAYGAAIARLDRPLFPCVPGLAAANTKLLQGSAPSDSQLDIHGGGVLPVVHGPTGPVVDVTAVETWAGTIGARLEALENPRRQPRQQQPQSQPAGSFGSPAARSSRGGRGGRGRGRDGPRGAGEQDFPTIEEIFAPAPQPQQFPLQPPQQQQRLQRASRGRGAGDVETRPAF